MDEQATAILSHCDHCGDQRTDPKTNIKLSIRRELYLYCCILCLENDLAEGSLPLPECLRGHGTIPEEETDFVTHGNPPEGW